MPEWVANGSIVFNGYKRCDEGLIVFDCTPEYRNRSKVTDIRIEASRTQLLDLANAILKWDADKKAQAAIEDELEEYLKTVQAEANELVEKRRKELLIERGFADEEDEKERKEALDMLDKMNEE